MCCRDHRRCLFIYIFVRIFISKRFFPVGPFLFHATYQRDFFFISSFVLILRAQSYALCTHNARCHIHSHIVLYFFSVNLCVIYSATASVRTSHLPSADKAESIVLACARLTGHLKSRTCNSVLSLALCGNMFSWPVKLTFTYIVLMVCAREMCSFHLETFTAHSAHNWHSTVCRQNTVVDNFIFISCDMLACSLT